jgi:hypothetical protein
VTRFAAYLYPWDIDGDPAAADRIAGLGITEVSLTAAYHDVRAVTPFHPVHRVVTRAAAVYYQPDPARWRGKRMRPATAKESSRGSFERAARRLRAAGLRVSAWLVIAHNETLGVAHPQASMRNAFGDPYPWALCVASPDVRDYAATLAAEVASADDVDGIDLEACGWYGFDHLSWHDKIGQALTGPPLDICFCSSCEGAGAAAGLDVAALRDEVRAAIDARASLPAQVGDSVHRVRAELAAGFLHAVVTSARAAAPDKPVLVHTHPDPRQAGSNPGFSLSGLGGADGVILGCPAAASPAAALVSEGVRAYGGHHGDRRLRIAATLPAVAALGGQPDELPALTGAVLASGATEVRFYHAGLASAVDLAAIRKAISWAAIAPKRN